MQPLTALLFDFGGTLDDDGRPWPERLLPLWRAAGAGASDEARLRAFYDADDGLPAREDLEGKGFAETVRLQTAWTAKALAAPASAAEAVAGRFIAESRAALRRNAVLLERLSRRFKLGVVSNFYGNLEAVLASEDLLRLFGAVADSKARGASKPDPALFLWALERLGERPSQALMVGDSKPRDMAGAEGLGMRHAWLAGEKGGEPCCAGTPVLRSLADLEALLAPVGPL